MPEIGVVISFKVGGKVHEVDLDQIFSGDPKDPDYIKILSHMYAIHANLRNQARDFYMKIKAQKDLHWAQQYQKWKAQLENAQIRTTDAIISAYTLQEETVQTMIKKTQDAETEWEKSKTVCENIWFHSRLVSAKYSGEEKEGPDSGK